MNTKAQPQRKSKTQLLKENSLTSPKAKGERLRRIRHLANLSREDFCASGEVNLTTLISWEVGRFGGLSAKGANRVITRVAKEGVFCTSEWLLYEVGAGPEVRADFKKARLIAEEPPSKGKVDESAIIIEELMLYRKLNKNPIDYLIEDDSMLPQYQKGDCVAGTKRFGEKIKGLIGFDCIIQTKDGRIFMRNLQIGPRKDSYNLVCKNLHTKITDSIIFDVELTSAAPVTWHRRKEPKPT